MCVLVKYGYNKFQVATRDIPFFAIKELNLSNGTLKSVCFDHRWKLNKIYTAERYEGILPVLEGFLVDSGFFHVSLRKQPLIDSLMAGEWGKIRSYDTVIVKGYIPKGAVYALGVNSGCSGNLNGKDAYVCEKAVITKIINIRRAGKVIPYRRVN